MSQTYFDHCQPGGECRHGPPDTIVYIAPDGEDPQVQADKCAAYARHRAWQVVDTIVEPTPDLPLSDREGWQAAGARLQDRSAEVIVTWHPTHVASDTEEFDLLQGAFREQGHVLVAATGVPEPPRPV